MPGPVRNVRRTFDIWPGFVDALATLLILIIFILMVFMVAQFYLSEALSGRDRALDRLNTRINELSEMLALEKDSSEGLRDSLADISAQLQITISARDSLRQRSQGLDFELAAAGARVVELEADLAATNALAESLESDSAAARGRIGRLETDLAAASERAAGLESELALGNQRALALERDLEAAGGRASRLETDLGSANERIGQLESALTGANQHVQRLRRELALANQQIALLDQELGRALAANEALQGDVAAATARAEKGEAQAATTAERASSLESSLAVERRRTAQLDADLAAAGKRASGLDADRAAAKKRVSGLDADLAAAKKRASGLDADLAAANRRAAGLDSDLSASRRRAGRLESQIGAAREDEERTRRTLVEEQDLSEKARAAINLLNVQIAGLRRQLASLAAVLDASEARAKDQKVQIADLGRRLNLALAEKIQELKRYRSEFFGRLRDVLGDRADIRVVGDRFVFQSELLFASGSAELEAGGAHELAQLAKTLSEVAVDIPRDIDWVLRVDGHTDRRPINTPQYPSNWELSTARAISVVRFLVSQGIPPRRLAATGFGEYQPLDPAFTDAAYRKNRRIELKLTQR